MFIQTEVTPNPATLKFLPGRPVMEEGTFEARDEAQAERSPLAKALMQLPGVGGVFFANDFISVTKTDGEWQHLRPAVLGVVTEFYLSGAPLIERAGRRRHDRRVLRPQGRRIGRGDQGIDRNTRPPGGGGRWRRHHLQGLSRGNCLSQDEGRLFGLPLLDRDAQARNRKPSQALPAGRSGGGSVRGVSPAALSRLPCSPVGSFFRSSC